MSFCDFAAGWISGMTGLVVGYPFDTIKVIQQTQGVGMMKSIQRINKSHGIPGYFRGLAFPLLSSGAVNSLIFGVYHGTLRKITELQHGTKIYTKAEDEMKIYAGEEEIPPHVAPYLDFFAAGCISGLASIPISSPIELIKIKLQTGQTEAMGKKAVKHFNNGPYHALKYIAKREGIRGLYRGASAMAIRDTIGNGVYMLSYEFFADIVRTMYRGKDSDPTGAATMMGLFIAGGMAGTASWWAVIPVDVVKSKMQADDPRNPKYSKKFWTCFRQVARESGLRGLYSGFVALTLRGFPVNGATFLSFELLFKFCHTAKKNLFGPSNSND